MSDNQIVFNSFPRSGNVYSLELSRAFFPCMSTAVHMPQIFSVKEIDNVTLFRKPEDAISSLIYKQNSSHALTLNRVEGTKFLDDHLITEMAKGLVEMYRIYIKYAKENADLIYIGNFDDLISDPFKHFKNIAKKFKKPSFTDYEKKLIDAKSKLTGTLWENEYDGHIPRQKSDQRKHIEQVVNSLPLIQELNQEYEEFILKYKTIV